MDNPFLPSKGMYFDGAAAHAVFSMVALDTSNEGYADPPVANGPVFGVIQDTVVSGTAKHASVQYLGETFIIASEAMSIGDWFNCEGTDGHAKVAKDAYTTVLGGGDDDLTFTANQYGDSGITIEYVDPAANSQSLAVTVNGKHISVSLATDGGGSITSTAALIKTAIEAHAIASLLVTVTVPGTSTGVVAAITPKALTGGQNPVGQVLEASTADGDIIRGLLRPFAA